MGFIVEKSPYSSSLNLGLGVDSFISRHLKTNYHLGAKISVSVTGAKGSSVDPTELSEITMNNCQKSDYNMLIKSKNSLYREFREKFDLKKGHFGITYNPASKTIKLTVSEKTTRKSSQQKIETPVDYITHHNQALNSWEKAKEKGIISSKGNILLHVDSHSDMYKSGDIVSKSIASFVNNVVADETVNEVYWLVPLGLSASPTRDPSGALFLDPKKELPYTITAYVIDGQVSFEKPLNGEFSEVPVHITRLDLMDTAKFTNQKNILLDIDIDYFSNSGHDTIMSWTNNPSSPELQNNLADFMASLADKNINPVFSTICLSPEYTNKDDQVNILEFFKNHYVQEDLIPNNVDNYKYGNSRQKDQELIRSLLDIADGKPSTFSNQEFNKRLTTRGLVNLRTYFNQFKNKEITKETSIKHLNHAKWVVTNRS